MFLISHRHFFLKYGRISFVANRIHKTNIKKKVFIKINKMPDIVYYKLVHIRYTFTLKNIKMIKKT